MHPRALHSLVVAAAALLTLLPAPAAEPAGPGCEVPFDSDPLADRAGTLARYERLPHACLQAIFTACTQAADQSLLDMGSAAVCSFGYEALLKQGFGGSFPALLAWWRSQRGETLQ